MFINNLMMVLYFLAYVLLYLFIIGEKNIRWKFLLFYSTVTSIMLVSAIQLTRMPEMNGLIIPMLMVLGRFYTLEPLSLRVNVTVSLLTSASLTVLNVVIHSVLSDVFIYVDRLPLLSSMMLSNLSIVSCFCIVLLFRNSLGKVGNLVAKPRWSFASLFLSLTIYLLSVILSSPRIGVLAAISEQYQDLLIKSLMLVACLLLFLLLIGLRKEENQKLLSQKEAADQEFLAYVQKLEESYNEMASFRHDYQNILLSLDEGIQENNLPVIKKIYSEVIRPSKENLQEHRENIEKVQQIKVVEVRSLLRVKLIQAQAQGIQVLLDIPSEVETIAVETVTLLRLISILLDNGIEASARSKNKQLIVSCFHTEEVVHFLIRNSFNGKEIDLKAIYQLGMTSNKKGRGVGLYSLKRLLDAHSNLTLITSWEEPFVTQELIIR